MSAPKVDVLALLDAYIAHGIPQERPDLQRARAAVAELIKNTKKALNIAESLIHDQLDGTSSLNESLSELNSVRAALARIDGKPPTPPETPRSRR